MSPFKAKGCTTSPAQPGPGTQEITATSNSAPPKPSQQICAYHVALRKKKGKKKNKQSQPTPFPHVLALPNALHREWPASVEGQSLRRASQRRQAAQEQRCRKHTEPVSKQGKTITATSDETLARQPIGPSTLVTREAQAGHANYRIDIGGRNCACLPLGRLGDPQETPEKQMI